MTSLMAIYSVMRDIHGANTYRPHANIQIKWLYIKQWAFEYMDYFFSILSLQMPLFQKEEEKELPLPEKGTLRERLPEKVTTHIENMSILAKKEKK